MVIGGGLAVFSEVAGAMAASAAGMVSVWRLVAALREPALYSLVIDHAGTSHDVLWSAQESEIRSLLHVIIEAMARPDAAQVTMQVDHAVPVDNVRGHGVANVGRLSHPGVGHTGVGGDAAHTLRVHRGIRSPREVRPGRVLESAIKLAIRDHLQHARSPAADLAPITVYLEQESSSAEVETALEELATAFGLETVTDEPAIRGSWFRKWSLRGRELGNAQIVKEIAGEVRRTLELQNLHRAQAEVDEKKAAAVSGLIQALADQPNAAIMIGSLLLLKSGTALTVRDLTQRELMHMERNPDLLENPAKLLAALQAVSSSDSCDEHEVARPGRKELPGSPAPS
uniref:Uncharacterized protein n=1 Tax=Nonomuraea gerenzanensis TaxID=93944 RepID=A0A1M4ECR9_9ACTN|nr:hypothetical protein BN4615_P6303 [Nonomuraea gerenzanensis]